MAERHLFRENGNMTADRNTFQDSLYFDGRHLSLARECYEPGYSEHVHQWMVQRRAASHARFFLPHLHAGMSLLDAGCGPGSITLDLAEVVSPGRVVGIDIEPLQIERAKALAAERKVSHTQFLVGDVYQLPFADASFDAVFAHATLYHVRDPLCVLREFHRVLKPDGLVGIRDTDYSLWFFEPVLPGVEEARRLALLVAASNGASPTYARQQCHLLLEAGFTRVEASASCVSNGTLERTRASARALMARLRSPSFQETVVQQGWSDAATLETLCAEIQAWGERPDAFEGLVWREAVAWVGTTR